MKTLNIIIINHFISVVSSSFYEMHHYKSFAIQQICPLFCSVLFCFLCIPIILFCLDTDNQRVIIKVKDINDEPPYFINRPLPMQVRLPCPLISYQCHFFRPW